MTFCEIDLPGLGGLWVRPKAHVIETGTLMLFTLVTYTITTHWRVLTLRPLDISGYESSHISFGSLYCDRHVRPGWIGP